MAKKKSNAKEISLPQYSSNLRQVPIIDPSNPPLQISDVQRSEARPVSGSSKRNTSHDIPTINSNKRNSPSYSESSRQSHCSRNEMSHPSNPSNMSTNVFPGQPFTPGSFLGLSYENSVFPGSSSTGESRFHTTSYPDNTSNVSYPSNLSGNIYRGPNMISKALNIDEFGSMDSDNEEDITNALTQTGGFWGSRMASLKSVDDSIDGVPVDESIISSSKYTSNQSSKVHESRSNIRLSDEAAFPKDPQNAMRSFIQAQSFRDQSKNTPNDQYKRQPISSFVRDQFMQPGNESIDLTSDNESIQPWATKQSSTSTKGKFMRPNDSADSESHREKRRPDRSPIRSTSRSAEGIHSREQMGRRDSDMGVSQASTSGGTDRRNAQRSDLRTVDSNRSREHFLRESSRRSSKVSKKEEIKSVKLSWHSSPVDRRKGESEVSHNEKESQAKNPLLKGLKQASKMALGKVKVKEHADDDERSETQNKSTSGSILAQTPQQGLLQNATMGLPANVVLPQDQASIQNMFMGFLSNLMLNSDQGLISNNLGIPGNFPIHPEQLFINSGGLGLGNNLVPPDQAFMKNANVGLPTNIGVHPSAFQEALRQQEVMMLQNSLLQTAMQGMPAAVIPQPSTRALNAPTLHNSPQPNMLDMLQPSINIQQPMTAIHSMAPQTTSASHRMPPPDLSNRPPSAMQNRLPGGIQNRTPVSNNNPPPSFLNRPPRVILDQPPKTPQVVQKKAPPASQKIPILPSRQVVQNHRPPATQKMPLLPSPPFSSFSRTSPVIQNQPPPVIQNQSHSVTKKLSLLPTSSIQPPAALATSGAIENTIPSPCVDEVMKKLAPDGTGSVKYPAPDTNLLTFDPEIGYRYDPRTGLHYDANSGYFFNSKLKVFLYWDMFTHTYLRVENCSIPFPVLRNQKDSTENPPATESPGNIINMKKLIEQHRRIKLEQDKANQDELSQSKIHSRSGDHGMIRSKKRNASPDQNYPKSFQPRSRSPKSQALTPKGVDRSKSPIPVKKLKLGDGKCTPAPTIKIRSISPGTSNRWRNDRRKSGSPHDRRRPLRRSPLRRRSFSKSPPGLPKKRSPSPGSTRRMNTRNRTRSPDHSRRRPASRSPQRRRSHSKSPSGLSKKRSPSPGSNRRLNNRNRITSPDHSRRRPASRSPQRLRSRSKSPPVLFKKRLPSPVPTRRPVDSRRHPGSRSPPRRTSRSRSSAGLFKKRSPSTGPSREIDNPSKSPGITGAENSKRHPTSRSPQRKRPFSRSPPGLTRRRSPSPRSVARRREQRGRSKTLDINEDTSVHPSLKVTVINIPTQGEFNEKESPKRKLSIGESTPKERTEEKSKTTGTNSSGDRRNLSSSDGRRYSSNKEKDMKSSDIRSDRRDRENSRITKLAKQNDNSPTSEGRNHRLISERQFSIGDTRKVAIKGFSFPQEGSSQSKPRALSKFDTFSSVESKEQVQKEIDLPGVPDDLSDFVVLDGVEDEDEGNDDMTEEALQLLLSDPAGPNEVSKVEDESEQAGDKAFLSKDLTASSTADENRNSHDIKKSAITTPTVTSILSDSAANPGSLNCTQESSPQEGKNIPGCSNDDKIQQRVGDDNSGDKLVSHKISTYSEPPSPTCSIFSSYDFSDDDKYVTVSQIQDEDQVEEEKCVDEAEGAPSEEKHEDIRVDVSKIETLDVQSSNNDSKDVGTPKPSKATKESNEIEKQPDISNTDVDSVSKTSCEDVESHQEVIVVRTVPIVNQDAGQMDKTVVHEDTVLTPNVVENQLPAMTQTPKECVVDQLSKEDKIPRETGQAEDKTLTGSQEQQKEEQIHGTGQAEDESLANSQRQQIKDKNHCTGQAEDKTLTDSQEQQNEEKSHDTMPLEHVKGTLNSEDSNEVVEAGVSNKEAKASQSKKVGNVFTRLGGHASNSEKSVSVPKVSENRVRGDTDPLSDLYNSQPSKFVHVKQSMSDFEPRTVKESITQHLFETDIDFVKITVNQKNNLGCPFEFIQVTFESAAKAEQWLTLTDRKVVLQHTSDIKTEYFLYYAQPPWRCSNCSKSWNMFFRSLCYLCYNHRSDPLTCFKFSETPTKYFGFGKIPSSAPLDKVMTFAPRTLNQMVKKRKSVRVVVDPLMNCCSGLIIIEMPKVKEAIEVYDWACSALVNQFFEYVQLDTNSSDDKVILYEVPRPKPVQKVGNNLKPKLLSRKHIRNRSEIDDELGVPLDFDQGAGRSDSFEDLQVSHRVVEYDSGLERPKKNYHVRPVRYKRSLSPIHHKQSVSPERYRDSSVSPQRFNYRASSPPPRRNVSPHRAGSSRGYGNQDLRYRSLGRSRHSRSTSPRHQSAQRYRSPSPRRLSPEPRHSPRRHSSPRRLSPTRQSSRPPKPDGTDSGWYYPPPDASTFQVESQTGLLYDPLTTLYYHPQSRLFYNGDLNIYLEYDPRINGFIRVE